MIPEYSRILEHSRRRQAENKKLIEKIKKQKPARLDTTIQNLHDKVFEDIDCLQCANCCQTTGPRLLNKDIDRLAEHERLRPAIFTEKYIRIDEDKDYVFKTMPCPFLDQDNYCKAYDARPNACREYPHTQQRDQYQKLPLTLRNSLICPAVALVLERLRVIMA